MSTAKKAFENCNRMKNVVKFRPSRHDIVCVDAPKGGYNVGEWILCHPPNVNEFLEISRKAGCFKNES